MRNAEILSTRCIYDEPGLFGAWPSIALSSTGELLVVFSGERKNHIDPYGKILLSRSSDLGSTWSRPEVVVNSPLDDRDPGIITCSDGSLIVSYFSSRLFIDWTEQAARYYGRDEVANWMPFIDGLTEEIIESHMGSFTIRSTDSGRSWTSGLGAPVHTPHGPVLNQRGHLLYLGSTMFTKQARIDCYGSNDSGKSWVLLGTVCNADALPGAILCEPDIIPLTDGRLLAQMRVNSEDIEKRVLIQSISIDDGRTWSPLEDIGVWGLPPHLLEHSSGIIISSYGHRREPFGQRVALSSDGGYSWPEILTLSNVEFKEQEQTEDVTSRTEQKAVYYQIPDLGYPATVELTDGSLYTVWYQSRPDGIGAVILGCRWRLPG